MRTRAPLSTLASTLSLVLFGAVASAQVHDTDIVLATDNGFIDTGYVDQTTGQPVFTRRVFLTTLDPTYVYTSYMGFDTEHGEVPVGVRVGFNIRTNLRLWNGASFSQSADPWSMQMKYISSSRLSSQDDTLVQGFSLAGQSTGEWHIHFTYSIPSVPYPTPSDPVQPPPPGVYLLELNMWTTSDAIKPSKPFWILFAFNADPNDVQAAYDYANAWLPQCPADIDRSGELGPVDLLTFLHGYFADPADPRSDYNNDGQVDPTDLLGFLQDYFSGECTPGSPVIEQPAHSPASPARSELVTSGSRAEAGR